MPRHAVFAGLVVDEAGQPAVDTLIGEDPCYVVNDGGFKRHISSEHVDRQVMKLIHDQISGNENLLSEQAAKMLGTDDIFSKAMLVNQLKNIEQHFEAILQTGIPEEARSFMGMSGFKVIINIHGEVVRLEQPTSESPEDE